MALANLCLAQTDLSPPVTLGELLPMIDPADDPGVTHFAHEARRAPPALPDIVRWSAQATADVDTFGVLSGSISGRIALPLEPAAVLAVRSERHRVATRLAELQRDELARGYVYAVLELACRWGYLLAAEPVLHTLADLDQPASQRWYAKAQGVQWERNALSAQLAAYAPAIARVLLRGSRGFLCRFSPVYPRLEVDDFGPHPITERVALERRSEALQEAFLVDTGVPELAIDGSLRYGGGDGTWNAEARVSLYFPIDMPGATGSVGVDADAFGAGLTVRVDGATVPVRARDPDSVDAALAREHASMELHLAGILANQAMLRAEAAAFGEVGGTFLADAATCIGLCPVPDSTSAFPPDLIERLDALALTWELARLELEVRSLLAVPPADLLAQPDGE